MLLGDNTGCHDDNVTETAVSSNNNDVNDSVSTVDNLVNNNACTPCNGQLCACLYDCNLHP